jgi:hypothetical protein
MKGIATMKLHSCMTIGVAVLLAVGEARGQLIFRDDFDTETLGAVPAPWIATQPPNTAVAVTDTQAVSPSNSLMFVKSTGATSFPQAVRSFSTVSGGVVRVAYRARTTTSNHDSLYVKLRNAAAQEIGGVRFGTTANIQYQLPNGAWSNAGASYAANTWYDIAIDYDLDHYVYHVRVNSTSLVTGAAFRTNTTSAASLLIQDRVFVGVGTTSFVDNVQAEIRSVPLTSVQVLGGSAVLSWASASNSTYSLWVSTNLLAAPAFEQVASNIIAIAPNTTVTTLPPSAINFWRVSAD